MQRPGGDVPCALCDGVEVDISTLVPTDTVSFDVLSYFAPRIYTLCTYS